MNKESGTQRWASRNDNNRITEIKFSEILKLVVESGAEIIEKWRLIFIVGKYIVDS